MALTDMQMKFVDEYILDGNVMQSALRAGYSKNYAKSNSYKLLDNVGIKEEIARRQKEKEAYLRQRFAFDAEVARDVLFQLMKDEETPHTVRLSAAKDLLDRAGYKPMDKHQTELTANMTLNNPFKDLTTEELRRIAKSDK